MTSCKICEAQGIRTEYLGESSRCGWERAGEHSSDLRDANHKSHMYCHILESHPELDEYERAECFSMKILKNHKSAFERQISEATLIMRGKARGNVNLLNKKQEYDRCVIPSLMVEDSRQEYSQKNQIKKKSEKNKKKIKNVSCIIR